MLSNVEKCTGKRKVELSLPPVDEDCRFENEKVGGPQPMKYIAAVWIHVGFVYQLLRKTGLFFVLLLLASVARAQEEKPLPMPQVTSKTTGKCVVVTHGVVQTLDSKTGWSQERFMYRAEPSATTGKKAWHLPLEQVRAGQVRRPGSLGDFNSMQEAVAACSQWLDALYTERQRVEARGKRR